MKNNLLVFCLIVSSYNAFGQGFSGKILDSLTKEGIPFASIMLTDYQLGARCDSAGNFTFKGSFPESVQLKASSSGYETQFSAVSTLSEIQIYLNPQHIEMHEVIVSGARNQLQRYNSTHIEHRTMSDLNVIPATNLGQSIEAIPGVYNSSTGNGVSKPVIRGLQGVRVVSLLNGIRIENQQWGGDHGMGLTDLGIGTVEVIKGPSSLLYGSDALGGVIYFFDEAFAPQKTHELKITSQFETNSMGTINSLFYKGSIKGLRINVGGRFNSQADYQLASNQFVKNSRFQESSGKVSLGWNRGKWISHLKYTYASARLGIPGHTHDSIISPELFKSSERRRAKTLPVQNFINHILSFENKFVFKKHTLDLLVGGTQNKLEEFEEKVTIPYLSINLTNVLYNFKMTSTFNKRFSAVYGIQGMAQNQVNGTKAEERLLPNSTQFDNGLYTNFYMDLASWKFQVGARADVRTIRSSKDSVYFPNEFEKIFGGYNFAIGAVYSSKKHLLRFNVSSGFRVPHLSELLSDGVHHGTFRYEIGNRFLKPEKAIQLDVSYEYTSEHLSFVLNPFISQVVDYVTINPRDSIIDGFQVFEYEQLSSVQLIGLDAGFHYHPHFAHFLHLESSFSYIRGFSRANGNLSLMPQPRINTSIIAKLATKSKFRISEIVLQHTYFLPQNNVILFETTSVDYSLLNLGINFTSDTKLPFTLQLGVRNLTNTNYINHLSRLKNIGLESPGRNVYIKLLLTINYHEKK